MFKTNNKGEAARELTRLGEQIESSYANFNIIRAVPTILCLEDALGTLSNENERHKRENQPDPRRLGVAHFTLELRQMLDTMLTGIMSKGFLDCSTKILPIGINFGVSVEHEYQTDIKNFTNQLREQKIIGKKCIIRVQERQFLGYPGAIFVILDGEIDKKIVQTIDNIFQLRQLMHKKGLLETMVHLAPNGTEVDFNEKSASLKYPKEFTFETIYQKIGLSHRMIENYTHITGWNSNLPERVETTFKTISQGKTKTNFDNLKLERSEIFRTYNDLIGFPKLFQCTYDLSLTTFFDIVDGLIVECYPNDNTLGVWKINTLPQKESLRKHKFGDIEKTVIGLSKFRGMFLINGTIFTTFERITASALSVLDNCIDVLYENDLKGKAFEKATKEMLEKHGLIVFPKSIEIFEPIIPKEVSLQLWGREKNRTDLDVIAMKNNALLFIECKDSKFDKSILKQGNKFRNYVVEQYYRVKWISENFPTFSSYVQNQTNFLKIDLSQKLLLFPLVVSNTLVNEENFEGAPLVSFSELKDLVQLNWDLTNNESKELQIQIDGRLHRFPWFTN